MAVGALSRCAEAGVMRKNEPRTNASKPLAPMAGMAEVSRETSPLLRVLSLGAGVQSTTLALMAAHGEITPMPDCAIFADTGWEPAAVYKHLDWLESVLPFPVRRVRREGDDLGELAIRIATHRVTRTALPPWFTKNPDGMLPQQCSKEFKVRVIGREVRRQLGLAPRERGPRSVAVEQWLGISRDEAHRMKPAEQKFVLHRYPLIEMMLTRSDCLRWMERNGYPRPPKSACIFCPWTDIGRWRNMKANEPEDWARAVAFDAAIRPGFFGMPGEAFVHRDRVPLDQVDLSIDDRQPDLFANDCTGMCGV